MLTRTKNPVLPSVYIDNSLIVPEPSKQKYHNPHPLLSPEDMDDYYEAFMDDKDMTETLFHVWMLDIFWILTKFKNDKHIIQEGKLISAVTFNSFQLCMVAM